MRALRSNIEPHVPSRRSHLAAAGGGPQNLVKTIEYVTPAALECYRGVADVRSKLLREPWPASTGLVCEALLRAADADRSAPILD